MLRPRIVAVLHGPVDGGDHLRHINGAVGRANLDVDDVRSRGDAAEATPRTVVAGDDAGHVRAVPVRIEVTQGLGLGVEGKIGAVDDLARPVESGNRRNTGIDEGDPDSRAVNTVRQIVGTNDLADEREARHRRRGVLIPARRAHATFGVHSGVGNR